MFVFFFTIMNAKHEPLKIQKLYGAMLGSNGMIISNKERGRKMFL